MLRLENGIENSLGTVYSKSGENSVNHYSFLDRNPHAGENYYQLRQVDLDGAVQKSEIVVVKAVYAEPIKARFKSGTDLQVQIHAEKDGYAQLNLIDMAGRNHFKGDIRLQTGLNEQIIRLNFIPTGVYILTVKQEGKVERLKILKN